MIRKLLCFVAMASAFAPSAGVAATLAIVNAWSRPATGSGVVYATIVNRGARSDRLLGGSSPLAARLEMHRTTTSNASGSMAGRGNMPARMTTMLPVPSVSIPAGGQTVFAPGGYHIMLIGLRHDLKAGERVPVRLHFAAAGWLGTSALVRPF
ncbi:MAG: copper chaperone PCu(A)C [Vulcanimicrobiaceae bacterium]